MIDFDNPDNNDFLAVNQFTVTDDQRNKRPDVVLFINGLPLVIIELKNPADESATVHSAFRQLKTYQQLFLPYFALIAFRLFQMA